MKRPISIWELANEYIEDNYDPPHIEGRKCSWLKPHKWVIIHEKINMSAFVTHRKEQCSRCGEIRTRTIRELDGTI